MMLTAELRPFLYIALNFLVGWLITSGQLDPSQKDTFIQNGESIVGAIIIVATSAATLYRVVKHPHANQTTTTVTVEKKSDEKKLDIDDEFFPDLPKLTTPTAPANTPLSL